MTTPVPTSNGSSITRDLETPTSDKREDLRQRVKNANETLTFAAMVAASPLDNIPRCYAPDPDLKHFPPLWFLGIPVTFDDLWNFSQVHNLVPSCASPSEEERLYANDMVAKHIRETFDSPKYRAKIEFVHDNTRTSHYCVAICSNYTIHLCSLDKLVELTEQLLKLWDFIKPSRTLAWYLDAAADPSPERGERAEWPLDFDLVWKTKYEPNGTQETQNTHGIQNTHGLDPMMLNKREILRHKVEESNKTLTHTAMVAASPLDNIPRCYTPDPELDPSVHNLYPPCPNPSKEDRRIATAKVATYIRKAFDSPKYITKIEFVHDNTRTSHYCASICSNYTIHLCSSDKFAELADRLLEMWDFIQPPRTLAWYLDAAANPQSHRGERTEWPLDFDLVWQTKYVAKFRSRSSIVPA